MRDKKKLILTILVAAFALLSVVMLCVFWPSGDAEDASLKANGETERITEATESTDASKHTEVEQRNSEAAQQDLSDGLSFEEEEAAVVLIEPAAPSQNSATASAGNSTDFASGNSDASAATTTSGSSAGALSEDGFFTFEDGETQNVPSSGEKPTSAPAASEEAPRESLPDALETTGTPTDTPDDGAFSFED